jgi:rhamnosyltransferase
MKAPEISVVIPVKNEALKIRDCIDGILQQTIPVKEIIVIDSGSNDGTIEILKQYKEVTLIEIPGSEFNHGETRNLGVSKATGEFVLFTVGDSRSYNDYWIEELMKGFVDEEVAGVCGQQVVEHTKDNNPVEWFKPVSEPEVKVYQFKKRHEFENLTPAEKKSICAWDDVTAMYRRSVLLKTPFFRTSYSEDAIWAKEVLEQGYKIAYNYKARVYHYHLMNADVTFKRDFTTMYFRYRQFNFLYKKPVFTLRSKAGIVKQLFLKSGLHPLEALRWYRYNLANHKASVKSYEHFMHCLSKGEDFLDQEHKRLCGQPPVPVKKKHF